MESNLYWRKRRQNILQSLNAQPTSDLPCTCTNALSTSNSSTCSSCTPLVKMPDGVTKDLTCSCKHLNVSPGKCQQCTMSPSKTGTDQSPLKMNGHVTLENFPPRFPCPHQGLVPNIQSSRKTPHINGSFDSRSIIFISVHP